MTYYCCSVLEWHVFGSSNDTFKLCYIIIVTLNRSNFDPRTRSYTVIRMTSTCRATPFAELWSRHVYVSSRDERIKTRSATRVGHKTFFVQSYCPVSITIHRRSIRSLVESHTQNTSRCSFIILHNILWYCHSCTVFTSHRENQPKTENVRRIETFEHRCCRTNPTNQGQQHRSQNRSDWNRNSYHAIKGKTILTCKIHVKQC